MFLAVEDSLHSHQSRVCLTCPGGNQTELSAQMESRLVIHPDEGVHILDVSLPGLLHHFGQHRLRHALPVD